MSELRFCIICILATASSIAWSAPSTYVIPRPSMAVSPTDFQSNVTALGAQNKKALDQQVSALLPKAPLATTVNPPTVVNKPQPEATTSTPPDNLPDTVEGTYAPQENPSQRATAPTPQQTQPVYPTSSRPAQSRTQTYTGFGGTSTPSKNSGSSTGTKSQTGGGWNIQY